MTGKENEGKKTFGATADLGDAGTLEPQGNGNTSPEPETPCPTEGGGECPPVGACESDPDGEFVSNAGPCGGPETDAGESIRKLASSMDRLGKVLDAMETARGGFFLVKVHPDIEGGKGKTLLVRAKDVSWAEAMVQKALFRTPDFKFGAGVDVTVEEPFSGHANDILGEIVPLGWKREGAPAPEAKPPTGASIHLIHVGDPAWWEISLPILGGSDALVRVRARTTQDAVFDAVELAGEVLGKKWRAENPGAPKRVTAIPISPAPDKAPETVLEVTRGPEPKLRLFGVRVGVKHGRNQDYLVRAADPVHAEAVARDYARTDKKSFPGRGYGFFTKSWEVLDDLDDVEGVIGTAVLHER